MRKFAPLLALALGVPFAPVLHAQWPDGDHAVFVMTNSVDRNEVIAYSRTQNGSLVESGHYATGGRGSGGTTDPLGSQGSLTLSQDNSLLFAVNAGSGTLSVFRVDGAKLYLSQVLSSGGSAPVAVAQRGDLVYVANFAGNSNVVGFRLDEAGNLVEMANSIRYLSASNSGPSSIAFSPDAHFLLVTEKITNSVDVFTVAGNGMLSAPVVTPNPLPGVFDVVFAPNHAILVVQTGGGGGSFSSISSYRLEYPSKLVPITDSVSALGSGACWVALTPNGQFAFTANSASSSISGFTVGSVGDLAAVPGTVAATLPAGSTDLDIAVSSDGKYAYTLNTGTGTVGIFAVQPDGTLKGAGQVWGLQAKSGYNGIAAY